MARNSPNRSRKPYLNNIVTFPGVQDVKLCGDCGVNSIGQGPGATDDVVAGTDQRCVRVVPGKARAHALDFKRRRRQTYLTNQQVQSTTHIFIDALPLWSTLPNMRTDYGAKLYVAINEKANTKHQQLPTAGAEQPQSNAPTKQCDHVEGARNKDHEPPKASTCQRKARATTINMVGSA